MSDRAELFNMISASYDRFNHLLSFGIDITWRKRAVRCLTNREQAHVLDIACGTGDLSFELIRQGAEHVTGCDISDGMLNIGQEKVSKRNLTNRIKLINANCRSLPFADNSFDIITCAYGVRNFEHRAECMREMLRVLKPGGQLMILEFAMPQIFPIKQIYNFYFSHIMPHIGARISGGDKSPYVYFYNSVKRFPQRENFMSELTQAGFNPLKYKVMTFGISIAYYAVKQ